MVEVEALVGELQAAAGADAALVGRLDTLDGSGWDVGTATLPDGDGAPETGFARLEEGAIPASESGRDLAGVDRAEAACRDEGPRSKLATAGELARAGDGGVKEGSGMTGAGE